MTDIEADGEQGSPGLARAAVVADDHPIIQASMARLLKRRFQCRTPILATSYDELADAVTDAPPGLLVVTDLVMPGMHGFDGLKRIRSLSPAALVVVYSSNAGEGLARAVLDLGCRAFVGKRADEERVTEAIATVLAGGTAVELGGDPSSIAPAVVDRIALVQRLSPQQTKVFQLLGDGLLNKQIAYKLGISEATVKAHVGRILETLGVTSRSQAAIASAWMAEHGLL